MSKRNGEGPSRAGRLRAVLEGDHRRLAELLDALLQTADSDAPRARAAHLGALRCMLLGHARAEEEVVYAYMYLHTDLHSLVEGCLEEHSEIEVLVEDLRRGVDDDDGWEDLVWALAATVELHLDQERRDVYRLFEAEIDADADAELAARYVVSRDRWLRHLGCDAREPEHPASPPR